MMTKALTLPRLELSWLIDWPNNIVDENIH
jgi:hypothetical protein